jgi:alkylation response protein AidB-like acyl-CoA dehydrogenase
MAGRLEIAERRLDDGWRAMSAKEDLVARARALRPLIEADADEAERIGTTTKRVVEAVAEQRLFWSMVPAECGGLEAGIESALAVFEELAFADGSTGWSVVANASSSCFAAIYCDDDAVREMFPRDDPGIAAGMFGPVGRALRADDGYVFSGNYRFGSGMAHATWIAAGAMEQDPPTGEVAIAESGLPSLLVGFVPVADVEVRGNWDVMGLVGTGSYDYAIDEQHVPTGRAFPLLEAVARRGGDQYRIGLFGLVASGHAGFALGVGKRALVEVLEIAATKQRMGSFEPVTAQQLFQHEFAMHDAAMRAARSYVFDVFGQAEAAVLEGRECTNVDQQRMRQATTYATRVAADAARFAYTWAGTDALRSPSVLQRCFRDIHAGTQHIYVDNNTLTGYTQALLAAPPEQR